MGSAPRPRWQQATALVSLGAGGAVTGLSFVPGSPADVTSPAKLPFALMALEKSAQVAPSSDAVLRSAIVHVAKHFLRMAEQKSPAEMEATIWRHASLDGADHGPSCAAFASLTLELGSHVAGHESWVTGGTSYPWPLHAWAVPRVDPNPASPNVLSVVQDAQNHHRWHPIGDGYTPQPGDWVLFDGHVEVVTGYTGGVLHTIGGDSLPNYSVNAHSYPGPLSGQGVAGFVDNGLQPAAAAPSANRAASANSHNGPARQAQSTQAAPKPGSGPLAPVAAAPNRASTTAKSPGAPVTSSVVYAPKAQLAPEIGPEWSFARSRFLAESQALATPTGATGLQAAARAGAQATASVAPTTPKPQGQPRGQGVAAGSTGQPTHLVQGRRSGKADIPGTEMRPAPAAPRARAGEAEIPGLTKRAPRPSSRRQLAPYQRHQHAPSAQPTAPGSPVQRAFIEQVAPGAMATQQKYGVPASVTIAQAIDESAWGQSILATKDHNLFGIKGTGPAGTDLQPTQEFAGGQLVDTTAPFRVYYDLAQSIDAHGKLLARSDYFTNAMANRNQPNAFAAALTGVYATDPSYGIKLIQLMRQYNLYRFDAAAPAHRTSPAAPGEAAIPGVTGSSSPARGRSASGSAAQSGSGQAATAHVKLAPGGAPNAAPPSGGHQRGQGHASRRGSNQAAGSGGGAARQAQRAAAVDSGWAPDSAIPGTGYPVAAAAHSGGGADQAATPGQADIPGLPGTAAAPNTHRAHRTRNGPRLRPAHSPASGHSVGRSQPVGAAGTAAGQQGRSGHPAKPEPAVPGPAVSAPASPAPASPARMESGRTVGHATNPAAHAHPGHQVTSPGVPPVPGVAGSDLGQPTGGSAAQASAGFGDAMIPGLQPAPAARAATAHGRSAMPHYGAVPQDGVVPQHGSVPQDGAWIPGLPGQGTDTARHPQDRNGAVPRGHKTFSGGHGTNLPPTRARRLVAAGQPPAQPGHRAAAEVHAPGARAARAPVRAAAHLPTVPAVPPQATAAATTPPGRSAITGATNGRPAVGRATATAPANALAPPAPAGPAPHSGSHTAGLAPAGPAPGPAPSPAPAPAPSPPSSAGTTFGSGGPIQARTVAAIRYSHHLPPAVGKAYVNSAKVPLVRGEPLYADVAGASGIAWEILAACDWMQCKAKPGLSPVYGEKLGTVNPDGTHYRTRSAALERCAYDLVELAQTVYHIDLTRSAPLSVRELANAFAAFRWGGLLKEHHTSAMEFPYSVAGLTTQHMHMRWPNIDNPQAPDKPGARFHLPFGAVPLVLSLSYPATA